jgi:hypothetical protein
MDALWLWLQWWLFLLLPRVLLPLLLLPVLLVLLLPVLLVLMLPLLLLLPWHVRKEEDHIRDLVVVVVVFFERLPDANPLDEQYEAGSSS